MALFGLAVFWSVFEKLYYNSVYEKVLYGIFLSCFCLYIIVALYLKNLFLKHREICFLVDLFLSFRTPDGREFRGWRTTAPR